MSSVRPDTDAVYVRAVWVLASASAPETSLWWPGAPSAAACRGRPVPAGGPGGMGSRVRRKWGCGSVPPPGPSSLFGGASLWRRSVAHVQSPGGVGESGGEPSSSSVTRALLHTPNLSLSPKRQADQCFELHLPGVLSRKRAFSKGRLLLDGNQERLRSFLRCRLDGAWRSLGRVGSLLPLGSGDEGAARCPVKCPSKVGHQRKPQFVL